MRKLALLALVLAGCGSGGVWSPSDPKAFDRGMFDASAIEKLPKEERPYVMGHAIGIYLYGKTLPPYVSKHYYYRPGHSSQHLDQHYVWEDVLIARSGGSDGNGGAIYYDDVSGDNGQPGHGNASGSNDNTSPGDPFDDVQPCGEITATCSDFLDPAATDARILALEVDAGKFVDPGMSLADSTHFAQEFQRGLDAALAMSDSGEPAGDSEVTYLKADAIAAGICQH